MADSRWPKMPEQQKKRTRYVINYLETGSHEKALEASGIRSPKTHASIIRMLKRNGTLEESAHEREPCKFTPDVMEAAKNYLIEEQDTPKSTAEVVAYLEGVGHLEPPTNNHNFLAAFSSWVVEQG